MKIKEWGYELSFYFMHHVTVDFWAKYRYLRIVALSIILCIKLNFRLEERDLNNKDKLKLPR